MFSMREGLRRARAFRTLRRASRIALTGPIKMNLSAFQVKRSTGRGHLLADRKVLLSTLKVACGWHDSIKRMAINALTSSDTATQI